MTTTEIRTKMAELKLGIEDSVNTYNETLQTSTAAAAAKVEVNLNDKIAEYTGLARKLCFMELKACDDPMLEAVKRLKFEVIGTKDEKISDERGALKKRTTVENKRDISLVELNNYCDGIGHDKEWFDTIMQFNKQLTLKTCIKLGIDPKRVDDSYAMSDLARQIDLGKDPVSDENILGTLQKVINGMIGEGYEATPADVYWLTSLYLKKSRKTLTATCSDHKAISLTLAQVCHHLVTGEPYDVEFKQKKQR